MFRGTTPIIEMNLSIDTSTIEVLVISFVQRGVLKFEKEACDCSFDGTKASIQLSQEETLDLEAGFVVEVQAKAKLNDGTVMASEIERLEVRDVFHKEVI